MTRLSRKLTAVAASGLLAATVAGIATASPANAADKTVFKVVGTTDVSDSGLISNVIEKDFEAANPTIDLQYTGQGTGAAITSAKGGQFSALLVHAASLENTFVGDGYSLEQYGRAIFWGDYVLVGPKGDPAGVMNGAEPSHDAVDAFQKIAAAGEDNNRAVFVSRGSTPGTTVQEHAIWALTSGVPTCKVSAKPGGGGEAPVTAENDNTNCSDSDTARPSPPWYKTTGGVGQAANINLGNTCGAAVGGNGSNCYVFTDRGTFNYLQQQGQAQNLQVVARDNDAAAPGGPDLLVNSFHAYGINPDATPNGNTVDKKTAVKFLNFLTSPDEQQKIGNYLGTGRQAAFIPSATPLVTNSALPTTLAAGTPLTIKGGIKNATPGTPDLNGVTVKLYGQVGSGTPTLLDSDVTSGSGNFTFNTTHNRKTTYSVVTPDITKIENSSLSPAFGDLLQGGTTTIGTVDLTPAASTITVTSRTVTNRVLTIKGTVSPAASDGTAQVQVYLGKNGATPTRHATVKLKDGATTFTSSFSLSAGKYVYNVRYANPGIIVTSTSPNYTTTVK